MLSMISRSSLCFANGLISGDIRKSNSLPPLMFQFGGCTPFGLNNVMNRTGGLFPKAPLAVPCIKFRNGSGNKGPAALRRKVRRSMCQFMSPNLFASLYGLSERKTIGNSMDQVLKASVVLVQLLDGLLHRRRELRRRSLAGRLDARPTRVPKSRFREEWVRCS